MLTFMNFKFISSTFCSLVFLKFAIIVQTFQYKNLHKYLNIVFFGLPIFGHNDQFNNDAQS